jgi:hypothetical protein
LPPAQERGASSLPIPADQKVESQFFVPPKFRIGSNSPLRELLVDFAAAEDYLITP